MKLLILSLIFLLFMNILSLPLSAQKHFNVTIKLPQGINTEKLQAWLDNGKEAKQIKPQSLTGKQMVLTGEYYYMYAVITLQYPPGASSKSFGKDFFIAEKPGKITFNMSPSTDLPFANYSLQNVLDFDKEKKQMEDYSVAERKKAIDYETEHGDQIFTGSDTAIRNYYFKVLSPAVARKKLQYIIKHPQSYYSFYTFRTEVAKPNIAPWDSLLVVFNSFPGRFRYSDEGNNLNAFLHARLLKKNSDAIDFAVRDIHNNTVRLSQFKGKKTVLLHFWATWCTPCRQELPALKEISDQYKKEDLQIISIALPSSKYADYLAMINKLQMNWVNVYNNPGLFNKYGKQATPRICLIDKNGKLVYDQLGLGQNNDFQLVELKQKLKELIQE
jgi:thiol-disulfide isomerase/thioredoxin